MQTTQATLGPWPWRNAELRVDLPETVERLWVPTTPGPLEMLYSKPTSSFSLSRETKPPVFFVHGGTRCAAVWIPWMQHLSSNGFPCYAISYRGHGASWAPWWLRMWGTTMNMFADDVIAGMEAAMAREDGKKLVIVGHSAGGGLVQYICGKRNISVEAMVLVGAVPFSGG
jgi:pimeloyl-ACP methyl ester carboxylesterase